LIVVYVLAVAFGLELLTRILQGGAVVGLFALVVIFQPEIRRALERIGRVGSFGWVLPGADARAVDHVTNEVARAAAELSAEGHGALIVLERETGLEDTAETGVMIHGDVSADLIRTIFSPRTALHDGAVIIRGETVLAAGVLLPLAETTVQAERFGTRHRAALGIAEQTDAIVVVVSEENGQISLVERARIVRNLNEAQMTRALRQVLEPAPERARLRISAPVPGGRAPRLADIGRAVRAGRRDRGPAEPIPPDEPLVPEPDEPPNPADAPPSVAEGATAPEPPSDASSANGVPAADEADGVDGAGNAPITLPRAAREPAGARGRSR